MTVSRSNAYVDDPGRQCAGKVTWSSRKKAKLHARRHGSQGRLTVYRCPHCGWFHLGARPAGRPA